MKTITVWNMKGGVGKTTISFNLAANLEHQGKRTLGIDFDPQANLTSFFEKSVDQKGRKYDIHELAERSFDGLGKSIYRSKYKMLDYVKGSNRQVGLVPHIYDLEAALGEIEYDYDYCVIDCHPDFSAMTQIALFTADLVIVPILLEGFSRDNLNLVQSHLTEIEYLKDSYTGEEGNELPYCIVANRVANRKLQKEVYRDIVTKHDYPILDICVSEGVAVQSANAIHKPLYAHRKNAVSTHDMQELTEHIQDLLCGEVDYHG